MRDHPIERAEGAERGVTGPKSQVVATPTISMVTQTNNGGLGHWLLEEMSIWHTLPIFVAAALVGMGIAELLGLFIAIDVQMFSIKMISGAALFTGCLVGWTTRRYYEEGKFG